MKRIEAIKALCEELKDELVVTNIAGVNRELYDVADRDLNLYVSTCMGVAASVGLGLALALPASKVVVLEGDGSMLMNLGALATIANCGPSNLALIVFDNESYESPGPWPSATAGKTDLALVAKGAGIANSSTLRTLPEFTAAMKAALQGNELTFLAAKVETGIVADKPMGIDGVETRYRFVRALAEKKLVPPWYEAHYKKH